MTSIRITDSMLASEQLAAELSQQIAVLFALENNDSDLEKLSALPAAWRAIRVAMQYDAEVRNGGHHQYFWNTSGLFNTLLESALTYFQADTHGRLFNHALSLYKPEQYQADYAEVTQENWMDIFSRGYQEQRFDTLDSVFYQLQPDLNTLVNQYIRTHFDEFSTPLSI